MTLKCAEDLEKKKEGFSDSPCLFARLSQMRRTLVFPYAHGDKTSCGRDVRQNLVGALYARMNPQFLS